MVGKTLGHYRIVRRLGRGGMGEVYVADDQRLERQVALKLIPAELVDDPARLKRFEREAKTVAALNHPNIVTVHSVEESDGVHFLTMELVRGQTLTDLLAGAGQGPARLLELAVSLADGVAAAHRQGVVHRDLKPDNVMISEEGRVKVLDFGLAKPTQPAIGGADAETADMTQDGRIVGTVAYMSPEQAQGKAVDPRSDVFSLGILLYEMATGRHPFKSEGTVSTLSSILKDTPPPVTSLNAALPRQLDRIITRCLAKDPQERFQSAAALHAELQALKVELDSGELEAAAESRPRVSARTLATVLVVAGLAVAAAWLWPRGAGESAAPEEGQGKRRIVVLPFENLGPAEDAYFAQGIAEEITSRLGSLEGLAVISSKSARQYVGSDLSIQQVGQELDVQYVLEGSVRWARQSDGSSRVKITPQLVRVADDTQLWSEPFDRVMEDIFDIQTEIAQRVIEQLGVTLVDRDRRAVAARLTESVDAYQAYLRARIYIDSPDNREEDLRTALRLLQRAVDLAPDFAIAHAEIGSTRAFLHHLGYDADGTDLQLGRKAIDRALELAPDRAEVRRALGYFLYWGLKDYDGALNELSIAERDLPNDADLIYAKGLVRRRAGDFAEGLSEIEKAFALNPRDANFATGVADTANVLNRFDYAIEMYETSISLQPDQVWSYLGIADCRWKRGELPQAREVLEAVPRKDEYFPWVWFYQGLFEGRYKEALERISESDVEVTGGPFEYLPISLLKAELLALLGDSEGGTRQYARARGILEEELGRRPEDSRLHGSLGVALAGLGHADEAVAAGRRGIELLPIERDAIYGTYRYTEMARILVYVGRLDEALDQLERGHTSCIASSPQLLKIDPRYRPLHDLPRFRRIVADDLVEARAVAPQ